MNQRNRRGRLERAAQLLNLRRAACQPCCVLWRPSGSKSGSWAARGQAATLQLLFQLHGITSSRLLATPCARSCALYPAWAQDSFCILVCVWHSMHVMKALMGSVIACSFSTDSPAGSVIAGIPACMSAFSRQPGTLAKVHQEQAYCAGLLVLLQEHMQEARARALAQLPAGPLLMLGRCPVFLLLYSLALMKRRRECNIMQSHCDTVTNPKSGSASSCRN
jgi:hypothetical protein